MKKLLACSILLVCFACQRQAKKETPHGFFPIKEFGKMGYINSEGKTVIACQFDDADFFSEGLAPVQVKNLWGFIDTTGKMVIAPQFHKVEQFSDSLCLVTIQKDSIIQNAFIRRDGSIAFIIPEDYSEVSSFAFGRATATLKREVCVLDKTGKVLFNTHYPYGGGAKFKEGIIHVWGGNGRWVMEGSVEVWRGDTTKYFDTNGNMILMLEGMGNGPFSEGLAMVRIHDSTFYVDRTGKIKIKPKNQDLSFFDFSNGMAQVVRPGIRRQNGFIDTSGTLVIPIQYEEVNDFKEGLASFRIGDSCGFIDQQGNVAITPRFERIAFEGFHNGLCRAKQNHQWGYINKKGEFIWKEQVGIEYTKLDFSKWKLDTLSLQKIQKVEKFVGSDNLPRKQSFPGLNELVLKVDTTDITAYHDKYYGYKLYLINASQKTYEIPTFDGRIKIIQQALNKQGKWQDIEVPTLAMQGNDYDTYRIYPGEFQILATPIFKGNVTTQLRFRFEINKMSIYSNMYTGKINEAQLTQ